MRPRTGFRAGGVLAFSVLLATGTSGAALGQRIVSVTSPAEQIDLADTASVTPLMTSMKGVEVTRQRVGPFTVLEERYREPGAQPLLMHGRSVLPRIHLSLDTPDRRVSFALTDDGSILSASVQSPGCSVYVNYLQYARSDEEWRLYDAMVTGLEVLAERCEKGLEAAGEYRRLLESVRPGFPAAVRAMKARVYDAFEGRMERCKAPEPGVFPEPFGRPC